MLNRAVDLTTNTVLQNRFQHRLLPTNLEYDIRNLALVYAKKLAFFFFKLPYPFLVMEFHRRNRTFHNYLCDGIVHFERTIGTDSIQIYWQTNEHVRSLMNFRFHESNMHDSHAVQGICLGTMWFVNLPYNLHQKFVHNTHCLCYTNRNPNLWKKKKINN